MRVQLSNMQLVYQTLCDYGVKKYSHKFEEFLRLITVVYHLPLLAEFPAHEEELLFKGEALPQSAIVSCVAVTEPRASTMTYFRLLSLACGGFTPYPRLSSASGPYWGTYIPQTPSCASPLVKCSLCPSIHGTHETV